MIFITHNVHHAYPVADRFTILKRGTSYGTFPKADVTREQVLEMMAGGGELEALEAELKEFGRADSAAPVQVVSANDAASDTASRALKN